jgi:hypothetical protein
MYVKDPKSQHHLKLQRMDFASPENSKFCSFPSMKQSTKTIMDEIIKLNVQGQLFTTTRATICAKAGSMLASKFDPESKFAPPKERDGGVFLDRNPKAFDYLLNYLRNGCQVVSDIPDKLLKDLCAEADYFGLIGLKGACDILLGKKSTREKKSKTSKETMKYHAFQINQRDAMQLLANLMNIGWRADEQATALGRGSHKNDNHWILYRPITK